MVSCTAMIVQALVRLLSIGVSVAMIGLACWSPLLAASQSVADPEETGRKASVYRRAASAPKLPAKFRRAREVAPPVAEPQAESPAPRVSRPGSEAPPTEVGIFRIDRAGDSWTCPVSRAGACSRPDTSQSGSRTYVGRPCRWPLSRSTQPPMDFRMLWCMWSRVSVRCLPEYLRRLLSLFETKNAGSIPMSL